MPFKCPLCTSETHSKHIFHQRSQRIFYKCHICELSFIDNSHFLKTEEEILRYKQHHNSAGEGYKSFLKRFWLPFQSHYLKSNMMGLDYGEGPYPMLREILKADGFENIDGYDLYFHKNDEIFNKKYDFIVLSEVIEHMRDIKAELDKLFMLLKPNGYFILSTQLWCGQNSLDNWQYMADPTHISILCQKTLDYLVKEYGLIQLKRGEDWFIFLKK